MFNPQVIFAFVWSLLVTIILTLYAGFGIIESSVIATVTWLVVAGPIWLWRFYRTTEEVSPWSGLNLDQHSAQMQLQALFESYGITGSLNVRDGKVFAVVPADKISNLVKRFRSSVALVKHHKLAGADLYYMEQNIVGLADLTIMEIEQAASVLERVEEDRNASRRLYTGFDRSEILGMARTACAHYVERLGDKDVDSVVLSRAIRAGQCDDHQFVKIAFNAIELLIRIKGTTI